MVAPASKRASIIDSFDKNAAILTVSPIVALARKSHPAIPIVQFCQFCHCSCYPRALPI